MLFLYDAFLWLLVAFHVVGGATLFRRIWPEESPWLGFLLPALAVVLGLNFIEHFVALPVLLPVLPVTIAVCARSIFWPGCKWEDLRLPTGIFLAVFACNFGYRCLHPDIPTDDSMADMNRILDFCFGDKVPPTDSWLPPFDHRWYYTLQHYAASIVKRLFDVDIGTACNTSLALLNSLICLAGCGVAFLAGGRRAWIAILTAPIIEAGFTGAMPLLVLTMPYPDFGYAVDIDAGWREHYPNPLFHLLAHDPHEALVLEPPGDWIWHPQYHANLSGFLLLFLAAFAALEVLGPRRVNWSWACLLLVPPLSMLAATWYVPLCGLLCAGSLGLGLILRRWPADWRRVLGITGAALVLMWPALAIFGTWQSGQTMGWTLPHERTPLVVFLIQWWPIYVPWIVLCFLWRRLDLGVRWLHGAIGFLFVFVELVTFGDWRWDTVEKMWGGLFGLGLVALLPPLMVSRNFAARLTVLVLLLATAVTLEARLATAERWIDWDMGFLHLDGSSYFREDPQKSRMLETLGRLHARTILAGVSRWNYSPPPGLAVFTANRCYVAWFSTEEICGRGDEARRRTVLNNAFYSGDMAKPLAFLQANGIAAVLIAPEDKITDARLAQLKQSLAPDYDYVDCKADQPNNAGVFLLRALPAQPRAYVTPPAPDAG
jgi:hypothetical protein